MYKKKKHKQPQRYRDFFRIAPKVILWASVILFFSFIYFTHNLPDIAKLSEVKRSRIVTLLDRNEHVITNFGDLYSNVVKYDDFPKHLIAAVIATEDRRFFDHFGIDLKGLVRASFVNLRAGKVVQGGSTISQQLAKIAFLSSERTLTRKLQEFFLAIKLEGNMSKKQILATYLNRVYMGSGIYGVNSAAKYYFGKDVRQINIVESAIIAGLLKAPTKYSPVLNFESSGKRAYQILLNMVDAGYLTNAEFHKISKQQIDLETSALGNSKKNYFAGWILDQVNSMLPDDGNNLIIHTTFDKHAQTTAEDTLKKMITKEFMEKHHASQAALVSMTNKGEVLAMVGGVDYDISQFNRVTQAQRQPGSSFKHLVYINAFERGATPNDVYEDEAVQVNSWQPRNSTRKYNGAMSLQEAFARSINTISVQLSEKYGRHNIVDMAAKLGITSELYPHPSIALGSAEVNLLELTGSYAIISNNGSYVKPYGITKITTKNGEILYTNLHEDHEQILQNSTIDYMKQVMRAVIENGSGGNARISGKYLYGKTGTSQDYRDAWFIGFSDDVVTGVWVGNDDNSPMKKVEGAGMPSRIWQNYMSKVLR